MNVPLHTGDEFGILLRQKNCNDLCPRDKPNEKIDVYDCPDILAILSWNMGRPAQLQPEKRSRQGRHLLFLHTKRLEIRGSRQIFCPTLAFARFFSGSRAQLWERSIGRLRLKMQKIHRVNLVRLNLLKSREIIERHWIRPRRNRPGPSFQKKIWRRLRERLSRAARRLDEDSLEIHSPAVESIHSRWIDSTWFSSFIERPWIDSTHKIQRIQV